MWASLAQRLCADGGQDADCTPHTPRRLRPPLAPPRGHGRTRTPPPLRAPTRASPWGGLRESRSKAGGRRRERGGEPQGAGRRRGRGAGDRREAAVTLLASPSWTSRTAAFSTLDRVLSLKAGFLPSRDRAGPPPFQPRGREELVGITEIRRRDVDTVPRRCASPGLSRSQTPSPRGRQEQDPSAPHLGGARCGSRASSPFKVSPADLSANLPCADRSHRGASQPVRQPVHTGLGRAELSRNSDSAPRTPPWCAGGGGLSSGSRGFPTGQEVGPASGCGSRAKLAVSLVCSAPHARPPSSQRGSLRPWSLQRELRPRPLPVPRLPPKRTHVKKQDSPRPLLSPAEARSALPCPVPPAYLASGGPELDQCVVQLHLPPPPPSNAIWGGPAPPPASRACSAGVVPGLPCAC